MEAFILRLQAQFPSTVSTVYRWVRVGTGGGGTGRVEPPASSVLEPCPHPRTSEKLVKAPRDGCAAGPRCLLCMCTLDVDTAGLSSPCAVLGRATRERSWGFVAPEVPSAPLCLQTAQRLLGLRPHISPRCRPLSHRLGWLPGPAAVLELVGPPAAAGGESPPRPVVPPTLLWLAPWGCTVWVHPGVLTEGQARCLVQRALQGGPPGPGHGAAVLWLPSEHEGLGERPPLSRVRDRWALASLVPFSPLPMLTLLQPSLELLPPYILSEAQLRSQRYCLFCWGREHRRGPSGFRFLPCGSPRATAEQEVQEYLLVDSEDEAGTGES